jgi:hypothetical protein
MINRPEITNDTEYLLGFIYKYSKTDIIVLEGYDSFLTYIYINILNTLATTIKINNKKYNISRIPSLNIYNFVDLKKSINIRMTLEQQKMCEKLLEKDSIDIIRILSKRYKYLQLRQIINYNCGYILSAEILEFINIFKGTKNIIETLSIIDFQTLNKQLIPSSFIETNDILYNILYIASYLFRDNNKISSKLYAKLVKYYFILKNKNDKLVDFVYQIVYLVNQRIKKETIDNDIIIELSQLSNIIELSDINKFRDSNNNNYDLSTTIIDILTNFYNKYSTNSNNYADIFIPFLSYYYKYDKNNKLQYLIQDLLCKSKINILYGGESSMDNSLSIKKTSSELLQLDSLTTDAKIYKLEINIQQLYAKYDTLIPITDLYTNINKTVTFEYTVKAETTDDTAKGPQNDADYTISIKTIDDYKKDDFSKKINNIISRSAKNDIKYKNSPSSVSTSSAFENKIKDIIQEITNLTNFEKNELAEIKKEFDSFETALKPIFEAIKNSDELKKTPILKTIYDEYLNYEDNDDKNPNPLKDLQAIHVNIYPLVIKTLLNDLNIIKSKLQHVPDSLKATINANRNLNEQQRGGSKRKNTGGSSSTKDIIDEAEKKFKEKKSEGKRKMVDIITKIKRVKANNKIDTHVEKKLATPNFIDSEGFNVFEKLIANYDKDINNNNIPANITNNLFYSQVRAYALDPEEELEITLNDKIIFIVLCYGFRFASLLIIYQLIDNNMITDISKSLFYYYIYYIIIFALVLFAINIDTFKLRILINYMNLHVSTTNVWMHLILMTSFIYLIYLLIINLIGNEKPPTELSKFEKIKLKYKLDLLTIIVYFFICILIFII